MSPILFLAEGFIFGNSLSPFFDQGVRGEVVVHAFEEFNIYISQQPVPASSSRAEAGTLIAMGGWDIAQTVARLKAPILK